MGDIILENDRLRLSIDPARGASILGMWLNRGGDRWVSIIGRDMPGEDPHAKPPCFVMAPWTNRVRDARFSFARRTHTLRPSSADGTAIHGDARSRPFRILDRSPISARLAFDSREHEGVNFPWPFACEARYQIDDATLSVDLVVRNLSNEPIPAGCGLHPYFPRRIDGCASRVELNAPGCLRYPSTRMLPSGPPARDAVCRAIERRWLPRRPLDDVFAWPARWLTIRWGEVAVQMTGTSTVSHLVLFSPELAPGVDAPFIAVEPVTMVNDAFNLASQGMDGTGVQVLSPGGELRAGVTVRCADLAAGDWLTS